MPDANTGIGAQLGKKAIRFAVTMVCLLLLKALIDALPVLKRAAPIDGTLLSPVVLANAIVDTAMLVAVFGFGLAVSRDLGRLYQKVPDLGRAVVLLAGLVVFALAYNVYELPLACLLSSADEVASFGTGSDPANMSQVGGPFGSALQQFASAVLAEGVKKNPRAALESYQKLAVVKMRQSPDLYGWVFLLLSAIPIIGVVVMTAGNLEAISDLLFRKAHAATEHFQRKTPGAAVAVKGRASHGLSAEDLNKLMQLKTLLDQGAITLADFEEQKKRILGEPPAPEEPVELRKLKQLLDSGALNQEEYEVQKRRFLAQL